MKILLSLSMRAEGEIVRNPRAGRDGGGFVLQVSAAAHPCRKRGVMDKCRSGGFLLRDWNGGESQIESL
jgi:hypothetical protein